MHRCTAHKSAQPVWLWAVSAVFWVWYYHWYSYVKFLYILRQNMRKFKRKL